MNRLKILLAFALGCLLSWPTGRVAVRVRAQGESRGGDIHVCADKDGVLRLAAPTATCPAGQRSLIFKNAASVDDLEKPKDKTPADTSLDKATLEDLNRRLIKLEELGCAALRKRRVVAPFEVVDRSGKTIFVVSENNVAGLFNGGGPPAAGIAADQSGGLFSAKGGDTRVFFGINASSLAGLSVSEQGRTKIELGKNLASGNYRLVFLSSSNKEIAGIGVNPETNTGLALFGDQSGKVRARIGASKDGEGYVEILGTGLLAQLIEGKSHGGKLFLESASGVGVAGAGDAGGYGVVWTGPLFYNQGPTGAPGSYLVGKR